jgi:Bacterial Ig-like domain
MKRRVSAAGLFVLGLVALVGVGCGASNRQDAESIKGKPVTGGRSVTRSVAWIESHRNLEPHAAVPEPEAPDPDAAGAESEAAKQVADAHVQEKPEPGEEGGPPKTASAQAAPLQRTGRAAIEPKSSLDEGTSFLGADFGDAGFIPPDSMGSVGPTQIVVDLNGVIRVFDKQGNPEGLDLSDSDFWSAVLRPGTINNRIEPTDPGVEYDRNDQRWIISAIDVKASGSDTNNRIMLAVSDGPTITDKTSFTFYYFNEQPPLASFPLGATAKFADYPQLGVDANAVYIGVNLFTSSVGAFAGTALYVVNKNSVETGPGPGATVTGFPLLSGGVGQGMDSPQPATDMDPTVGEGYVVGPDNQFLSRLHVARITNPGGTPSLTDTTLTVPSTSTPLAVPAQGTTGGLDPLDDRLFAAMVGRGPDGTDTLWTAHNIRVNSSGAASSSGDRDGARWYQIGNLSSSPSLLQSGTLFDTAASSPRYFWMPSIAMNGQGHASLNASTAGPGRFAEVASSAHLATDPPGTTEAFDLTQSSNSTYNLGSDSPKRWGDYSQTVVDPTDDQTFWTFQEYARPNNNWGVRVIQLKAPPPATPASASPDTVQIDPSPQHVTVNGISASGSGFFDTTDPPSGPPYSHIGVTVTNADGDVPVVPGSIQVDTPQPGDPVTTLEFDLDTSAVTTPGFASIMVTNPDGQSSTCSNALIIGSDATAPSTPSPQGTTPSSPGNDTSPRVFGSAAECGSQVNLYTSPGCAGSPLSTGSATAFASPGIPIAVPQNASTMIYAQAVSVANVPSGCSNGITYVEDSIPPSVGVDSGPSGTTTDTTPTFAFNATDAVGPITFRCSIDTGTASFRACSGPGNSDTPSSPLAAGAHTFRVEATDGAGNTAVATRSFTVQIPQPPAAPDTAITKGPKKKTTARRPKFKFTSSQAGATFQCRVDNGAFTPCASPFKPRKLGLGKHVLRVRAVGPTGLVDPAPAVKKFKVVSE